MVATVDHNQQDEFRYRGRRRSRRPSWLVPILFLLALGGWAVFMTAARWLFVLSLIASFVAVVLYAVDKRAALNHRRRLPESWLHGVSLVGGWPGAWLAQNSMRHKTIKRTFQRWFWVTVFGHWLLTALGLWLGR